MDVYSTNRWINVCLILSFRPSAWATPQRGTVCIFLAFSRSSSSSISLFLVIWSFLASWWRKGGAVSVLIKFLTCACVPQVRSLLSSQAPSQTAVVNSALNPAPCRKNGLCPVPLPQLQWVFAVLLKPALSYPRPQINAFVLLGEMSSPHCWAAAPLSNILWFFLIYSVSAHWGSGRKSLQRCWEVIKMTWPSSRTQAMRGSNPLPCPWNMCSGPPSRSGSHFEDDSLRD